jgi:hypothetical protein
LGGTHRGWVGDKSVPMISADGNISAISLQASSVGSSFKCQQVKV